MSPRVNAFKYVLSVELVSISVGLIVFYVHYASIRNIFGNDQVALNAHTNDSLIVGIIATALAAVAVCVVYKKSIPPIFKRGLSFAELLMAMEMFFALIMAVSFAILWLTTIDNIHLTTIMSVALCAPLTPWILDTAHWVVSKDRKDTKEDVAS